MASELYSALVTRVRETFPDCTSTLALTNLNLIVRQLCRSMPLYRNSTQINLVASTQEYTLADTIGQINQVFYETSATSRTELDYRSIDALNQEDPTWRYRDDGTPRYYYITQVASASPAGVLKLGLDPTPDTTTASGYPILTIYYTEIPSADFVSGDNSPTLLERPDVLVYGANLLYAQMRQNMEAVAFWQDRFDKEHSRQWEHFNHKAKYSPPRIEPASLLRVRSKV